MPPLDFPPGTPGATYTGPNGVIWSWDGAKWLAGTGTTVYAPITDAALQGQPTAPTPPAGDADTSIATTAFVTNAVATSLHDVGRNYLHNSMFNVQQRGVGGWTVTGYTLDRWTFGVVGGDTSNTGWFAAADADRTAVGDEAMAGLVNVNIAGTAAAAAYTSYIQRIEDVRRLAGKTVTVSFWAVSSGSIKIGISFSQVFGSGGSPSATVSTTGTAVTVAGAWARYVVTATLPSIVGKTLGTNGNSFTGLNIWFSSGANNNGFSGGVGVQTGSVNIWGVQLELGPTATPLEKLDPVTQLQQCQRFFQQGSVVAWGYATAGITWGYTMQLPVNLRATPVGGNVTFAAVGNVNLGAITAGSNHAGMVYFWGAATAAAPVTLNGTYTVSTDL